MRIARIITLVGFLSGALADKLGAASNSYLPPAEESASSSLYQYDYGEDEYGEVPADQQAGSEDSVEASASEVLDADAMNLKMLMGSVPGTPGEDYPIFATAPDTDFSCSDKIPGGYYADPAAECQAYHVCGAGYARLCPNGTIFNQELFNCDWWYNVDCASATSLYSLAEGAFGTAGGAGGEGGDGGQCPAAAAGSDAECEGISSNCWSPGQRDTDCPNSGLCCFDGCANTCVDAPPPQVADDSRPVPDVVATTTAGYEYEVPEVTLPIRPVSTPAPIPVTTPAALYGAPPQRRQGRQRNNRRGNQRQRNNRRGRRQRRPTGNYVFV